MLDGVSTMPLKNRSVYRRKVSDDLKQNFKLVHAYYADWLLLKESVKLFNGENSICRMMSPP